MNILKRALARVRGGVVLDIRPEDIAKGERGHPQHCPAAHAAQRLWPNAQVSVAAGVVSVWDRAMVFGPLIGRWRSDQLGAWTRAFDRRQNPGPTQLVLMPDHRDYSHPGLYDA